MDFKLDSTHKNRLVGRSFMKKEFQNCLRIQIVPDKHADERMHRLVEHCKKFGFNNVIFFTTAEEFFIGHATIEEIQPWVKVIKKAAKLLRANNISIGLHHWISIGHLDRGIGLKEGQNFTTMVDFNGKQAISVACPLDANWRDYFAKFLGFLIQEIKPDYYWVEDDFRLHNHDPLEWGGCFCENHIAEFNKMLGTDYSREEFCEKAFSKGMPTKERQAWLDVSRQTMLDLAKFISKTVKDANKDTTIGLMSSTAVEHCLEARDWDGIFEFLGGDNAKLNRIHLPGYFETNGKDYLYEFNSICMPIRTYSPNDTEIMPELENGSIALFRKNARYVGFQLETSLPLCLSGMTYNIYDPVGNGPIEEYGFAEQVQRLTPYIQAVIDTNITFSNLQGVVVPIDEKIVYKKKIEKNFYDLRTNLFQAGAYASALGLSYRYSKEREFVGETVFLFGDAVYLFTDEQLRELFKNNKILIDGGAVLLLRERGLLSLIGAIDAELYPAETGYQMYEQITDRQEILGVKGFRASCRLASGNFVKVTYDKKCDNNVLSYVYKSDGTLKWNSLVQGNNFLVNPYVIDKKLYTQFTELRRHYVTGFVDEQSRCVVDTKFEGVSPYLYTCESGAVVILINGTLETFDKTHFFIKGIDFNRIVSVDKDGIEREVTYTMNQGNVCVERPIGYMSSVTFKLLKKLE